MHALLIHVTLYSYTPFSLSLYSMSLGGPSSNLLDDAVNEAVEAGVHMIVAAGNEFQNACLRSPAGANGV